MNQQNNTLFNQVQKYLQDKGYKGPNYTIGNPLSLLADEPIHTQFIFTGNSNIDQDHSLVNNTLKYKMLGFNVTKGQGFISISHQPYPTHIQLPLDHILINALGPVTYQQPNLNLHKKNDTISIHTIQPITQLTKSQAILLANAILNNCQ